MTERRIIVIGAGLSGLSAGVYARLGGYPCLIVEQYSGPGGVASCWKRGEYLIDGGIHFFMGHRPQDASSVLFRELLGGDMGDRVAEMRIYGRYVDENKGRRVDVTRDLDRLARDLKGYAGEDLDLINLIIEGARRLRRLDLSRVALYLPPELSPPLARLGEMWAMRRAWRSFSGAYGRSMSDFARACFDPWLSRFLANLFLPDVPVWFVCFLLALLADGGLGYLKNGSLDFVRSIEKRFLELGGDVAYNAPVESILVENGRASGVRLEDGRILRSGAVISAADGRETLFRLLGGRYLDKAAVERYSSWKLAPAGLTVSFGLRRELADEVPLTTISLMHPISFNGSKVQDLSLRIFNYSPAFAPKGRCVLQAWAEADFDSWQRLRDGDPSGYESEKKRAAEEILKRLEKHYPGISGQVELADVVTPATVRRITRNHRGASMAWMPTPRFFKTPLRRTLKGVSDFALAGQWVAGSGVVPCLLSGKHAVEILHRSGLKPSGG
ncbi:MAG: NAD(P)/FAD-dependent oxidoreductase [Candidatus Aminicenantes bacterium]|nr:NAD(P)/FAD-dependent oxidoreductase [Candidatus Aminicenantes bacterium]